eukprot:2316394-Lingulodinium_polyedra.AAC.1
MWAPPAPGQLFNEDHKFALEQPPTRISPLAREIERVRSERDLTNMNSVLTEALRDLKSFCNISDLAPTSEADPATSGRRQAAALLRAAVDKYNT